MNQFKQIPNKICFKCGNHPIERFCGDRFYPTFPPSRAREYLIRKAEEGSIINRYYSPRYKDHRLLVRNGNMYFPCVLMFTQGEYDYYLIKTIKTWQMVIEGSLRRLLHRRR